MLKNLAKDLLLPFYGTLCRFFDEIFYTAGRYDYVVFIARRCSNLAEIFFRVRAVDNSDLFPANFITDSAMLSLAPRMAETYRWSRRFPTILVVDDIVIYGKALNAFLEELEDQLYLQLGPEGVTREEISAALLRAVKIRAFARNNQPLLLISRYQSCFTVMETMEPKQWRDLSNRISRLILVSGQVNSSFISGARIPQDRTDWSKLRAAGFSQVMTSYDIFPEDMFCRILPLPDTQYIIYTVRVSLSSVDGRLVAAPFVLLPNMEQTQMDVLTQNVLYHLRAQLGDTPLDPGGSWKDCPRTRAEALTLLLSISLLQEFCARIECEPEYNGAIKLQMNFGTALDPEARRLISRLLDPNVKLLSMAQMDRILLNSFGAAYTRGLAEEMRTNEISTSRGSEWLKERIEDLVYDNSLYNYSQSYWQTQMYQEQWPDSSEETADSFTTVSVLMRQLPALCRDEYPFSHAVGWVFQMVDAGILAIAVRSFTRGRTQYVGQCVKTGEPAQSIMPKRLREFVPVLVLIQRKVRLLNKRFTEEFDRFAQVDEEFDRYKGDLSLFVKGLWNSGQDLEDWDFDLVTLPDYGNKDWMRTARDALRTIQSQQRHMDRYINLTQAE